MESRKEILRREMSEYAGEGFNGTAYFVIDEQEQIYAVASIAEFSGERIINVGLFVQFIDETIIIEKDINDKPLVDALVQAGVPREKIVLAYAGEKIPEKS